MRLSLKRKSKLSTKIPTETSGPFQAYRTTSGRVANSQPRSLKNTGFLIKKGNNPLKFPIFSTNNVHKRVNLSRGCSFDRRSARIVIIHIIIICNEMRSRSPFATGFQCGRRALEAKCHTHVCVCAGGGGGREFCVERLALLLNDKKLYIGAREQMKKENALARAVSLLIAVYLSAVLGKLHFHQRTPL